MTEHPRASLPESLMNRGIPVVVDGDDLDSILFVVHWLDNNGGELSPSQSAALGRITEAFHEQYEQVTKPQAEARMNALLNGWEQEAERYRQYAEGSSLPEMHRAIAKTLNGVAAELRAALGEGRT